MVWTIRTDKKSIPILNDPILIAGLPGIGNVGKVAVDFLIDELGAKKFGEIFSPTLPNTVFITEDNLVELPAIEIFIKRFHDAKHDLVFLSGDVQPTSEVDSYDFCYAILDLFKKMGGRTVVTLGGIGLAHIPENPRVYVTGNDKKTIKAWRDGTKASDNIHGIVGPIVGAAGLLLGLASEYDMMSVSFLAETLAHPFYIGVKSSEKVLRVLDTKLKLKLNMRSLQKEIKQIEEDFIKRAEQLQELQKSRKKGPEVSYIG